MHERALMQDVMRKIDEVASESGAGRVTAVQVRLGPLSHFTPAHFAEHFADASRGTRAEGALVAARVDDDLTGEHAAGVVLESVEVEDTTAVEVR